MELFEQVDSLGIKPWTRIAWDAGIRDTVQFEMCRRGAKAAEIVEQDRAAALALGIMGTPTLILDSLLFLGSPGVNYLEAYSQLTQLHP